jgi:hypothetical protein
MEDHDTGEDGHDGMRAHEDAEEASRHGAQRCQVEGKRNYRTQHTGCHGIDQGTGRELPSY